MTLQKISSWLAAANDLEAMFRDWTRQDDEYGSAMMQLEPEDRDQVQEERERDKVNAMREKLIRQKIMAIPEVAELVQALEEICPDEYTINTGFSPKKIRAILTRANEIKI